MLAVDATDAQPVLLAQVVEATGGQQLGQLDVNRGSHSRAEVGRTRRQVAEVRIEGELEPLLERVDQQREAREGLEEACAHLHADDAELILFVHPDERGLLLVVEDATPIGPVAVAACSLEVLVPLLEQEVVLDHLLLHLGRHAGEGVVVAHQVAGQRHQGLHHLLLDLAPLLLGDARSERDAGEVAAAADARRDDARVRQRRQPHELGRVEILGVRLLLGVVAVVEAHDLVEERREQLVGLGIRRVAAHSRIGVDDAAPDHVFDGEAGTGRLALQLVVNQGQNLSHQALVIRVMSHGASFLLGVGELKNPRVVLSNVSLNLIL